MNTKLSLLVATITVAAGELRSGPPGLIGGGEDCQLSELSNTSWDVTKIITNDGTTLDVPSLVGVGSVYSDFGDDCIFNGESGCNQYVGEFSAPQYSNRLIVGDTISTTMECEDDPNAMQVEFAFWDAFDRVETYEIQRSFPPALVLKDAFGNTIITYEPSDREAFLPVDQETAAPGPFDQEGFDEIWQGPATIGCDEGSVCEILSDSCWLTQFPWDAKQFGAIRVPLHGVVEVMEGCELQCKGCEMHSGPAFGNSLIGEIPPVISTFNGGN